MARMSLIRAKPGSQTSASSALSKACREVPPHRENRIDSLLIRRRELEFLLYDLLQVNELMRLPRFAEHSRATFDAALDTAYAIAEEHFATHAHALDEREPSFDGERVHLIPEVKAALDAFCAAGFMAATQDYDAGGMQLPAAVEQACMALFSAANISTVAYAFLTRGAANLIGAHGSNEQRERYLPPMREGRFFGTMALTEPQAGLFARRHSYDCRATRRRSIPNPRQQDFHFRR